MTDQVYELYEKNVDQHYEVHCGECGWWGMLNQLTVVYKSNPHNLEDVLKEAGCPMCLSDQRLEYEE